MLAYELALRETPTDKGLLFKVAYKYSEHSANSLALYHYGALLVNEPTAITLNNAGVAAEALKLPIKSINYYRDSEEKGETLAVSNLASRFLAAGFRREAQDLLQSVVSQKDVNSRVYDALSHVSSAEKAEEDRRKEQVETINKVLPWRLRHAEAMLAEPPAKDAIAGHYAGNPDLKLEVDESGNVTGSFALPPTLAAFGNPAPVSLKGKVKGKAIDFTWKVAKDEGWLNPRPSSGHGVLVWSESGLSGFRVGGDWALDLIGGEGFTEWELRKQAAS